MNKEIMSFSFYKNNFLSQKHNECGVGASCAVDISLDLYCYVVCKRSKNSLNSDHQIVGKLNRACFERDLYSEPICSSKHDVWNWLVANMTEAYSPKGRGDAEVLRALRWKGNESDSEAFGITQHGQVCSNCGVLQETQKV